jgi:hypothetical protein
VLSDFILFFFFLFTVQIEVSIAQREARIKAQEREIDQLKKIIIIRKHHPASLHKHLEICIAFDISGNLKKEKIEMTSNSHFFYQVSWVDKFVESVTELLDELKTLYEYKINISLIECGGPKRCLDFHSIEDSTKVLLSLPLLSFTQ